MLAMAGITPGPAVLRLPVDLQGSDSTGAGSGWIACAEPVRIAGADPRHGAAFEPSTDFHQALHLVNLRRFSTDFLTGEAPRAGVLGWALHGIDGLGPRRAAVGDGSRGEGAAALLPCAIS